MSIRKGDFIEAALWFNADHDRDKADAVFGIVATLKKMAAVNGFVIGDVEWEDIPADDRRLTDPPPEEFGGRPRCLVGRAQVKLVTSRPQTFLDELMPADLERLRAATRKRLGDLSDRECDEIIERIGPETATRVTVH